MKNIVVIYWSGTGNTRSMASAVAEGARIDGITVQVLEAGKASPDDVLKAHAVALGCPAMGNEVLEEEEMEPLVQSLTVENMTEKPLVLFGSYDWGDGQWMRDWQERMEAADAKLVAEGLIIQNTPDEAGLASCRELGKKLASALA